MKTKKDIVLNVNGTEHEVSVEPRERLLDVIRYKIGLTGTKEGCGTADCGACTVLMDGKPVTSCMILGVSANGAKITTVEGISSNGKLHPVQECFMELGGLQCGICTPGFIVAACGLLKETPDPTQDEVRYYLAGNLCRCTGYTKIIQAVLAAAERMRVQCMVDS